MTNNDKLQWAEATEAVKGAASILVVTHMSPDGDAIGSLLGLTLALREMGKKVDAVVDGGVPDFLRYLTGANTVQGKLKRGKWDVMISSDASDEERTGLAGEYGRKHSGKVINLDHHPTNTYFGDLFLVLPQAVSATEIVYRWLKFMEHPFSVDVASALLTGLVTDTMGFRTNNVVGETMGIAQQLMDAGALLYEITQRTMVSKPFRDLNLLSYAFPSVKLTGNIISGIVTQEDLKHAGQIDATDGGLVSQLITANEAVIAVVYKELSDNKVELSFRSKPGFDVGSVAFGLGGGGHKQASGATIDGPLDAAIARVTALLEAAAAQGTALLA
ncbi:MAG: bifunctional oligoribonuclease/PAP phosphatase NrnA [Chloroflexota bacterium]